SYHRSRTGPPSVARNLPGLAQGGLVVPTMHGVGTVRDLHRPAVLHVRPVHRVNHAPVENPQVRVTAGGTREVVGTYLLVDALAGPSSVERGAQTLEHVRDERVPGYAPHERV